MGQLKRIWPSDNGDLITRNYIVYRFSVSDLDDPDVYAGAQLHQWEQSDSGKWILENAFEKPIWHRQMDHDMYCYRYIITAHLTDAQITFFELKYK